MAISLRILTTILVTLTICSFTSTEARPLLVELSPIESTSLMTRLNLDGNSVSCWESLFKLQSCSRELFMFFYNGQTYLGSDCCHSILIIVQDCWPAMLGSLGFTAEEGNILAGYCDAEENNLSPKPSSPPHAPGPV